ncbi:MAG TPA: tetratricopeptide repeat protein [Xanthobacteraceae bacterium]|jgi:TPR repeat protein
MMSKRSRAFSAAGVAAIGLLALAIGSPNSAARAQSAALVLCDRLAADPADPDKPSDVKGTPTVAASDIATAIKFCNIASTGSRRALYELGRAYAANQQWPEAVSAYRKAAERGSTSAMVELGAALANGSGVAKDETAARKLFARAAAAGNPRAAAQLAGLGDGDAAADPVAARALLAKAAETNSAEAQFQLGIMLANGVGGPKDDVAARAMFEKAAAQDHPAALDWMGNFAETGRGGPRDLNAAKADYEKAAALGNDDAKAALQRLNCPLVLKDKSGHILSHLCL